MKKLGLPEREERFIAQWLKLEFTALGSFLYRTLLPTKISNVLRNSKVQFLSLEFDDALTDIPWELMYDGENFFNLKYAIGRRTASKAAVRSFARTWTAELKGKIRVNVISPGTIDTAQLYIYILPHKFPELCQELVLMPDLYV